MTTETQREGAQPAEQVIQVQRRSISSRRIMLYMMAVVFVVWALSVSNIRSCSGGDDVYTEPTGEMSRGAIMLQDSFSMMAGLQSFSYMYTSGGRWSAGDVLVETERSNKRLKLGPSPDSPEYEVRRVGDDTWWRIRGADGWRSGPAPFDDREVIDLRALADGVSTFTSEADDMRVLTQGWTVSPLSERVSAHHLNGWVSLRGVRALGLGIPQEWEDGDRIVFDLWIEQDSGVPSKMVFQGVSPSPHPTGVLYIFDAGRLTANTVIPPHADAMASGWSPNPADNERAGADRLELPAPPPVPLQPGEVAAPVRPPRTTVDTEAPASGAAPTRPAGAAAPEPVAAIDAAPAAPLMIESHPLPGEPDWTRVVLPTEGYTVEVPSWWEMDGHVAAGGSTLSATGTDGDAAVSIRRFAAPVGLLGLTQDRISDLNRTSGEGEPIEAELLMEMDRQVPRAILVYMEGGETVHEYLTVRGAVGAEGIAYSVVFRNVDAPEMAGIRDRIADSHTLLGLAPP